MAKESTNVSNLSTSRSTTLGPSGRLNKMNFKLTWSHPKNCEKQIMEVDITNVKVTRRIGNNWKIIGVKSVSNPSIGKTTGSYQVSLNASDYYPGTPVKLSKVVIKVKAKQKSKSTAKKYKDKTFTISVPRVPEMGTVSFDTSTNDACTFSWSRNSTDPDTVIFDCYAWETILSNSKSPTEREWTDGLDSQKIIYYDPTTGTRVNNHNPYGLTTGTSVKIYESQATIQAGKYRHFRVHACGPAGPSSNASTYHKYGEAGGTKNESATITNANETATEGTVSFNISGSKADTVACQYAIVNPPRTVVTDTSSGGITRHNTQILLPTGFNSWTTFRTISGPADSVDNIPFSFPPLGNDDVIFFRTQSTRDGITTDGTPFLKEFPGYMLPEPAFSDNPVVNPETHKATLTLNANSRSGITGAVVAVYFRTLKNPTFGDPIGVFKNTDSSITIDIPEWDEGDAPAFGVRAIIADQYYINNTEAHNVKRYTFKKMQMDSSINWERGTVPVPPQNITLSRYKEGMMLVNWDWTWPDANIAEVSWSQTKEAWDSTEEPSTYNVSSVKKSELIITGLSAGTWWVKVRLLKTDDQGTIYGAYSDAVSLSMSAAPDVPTLTLSTDIAAVDEDITAYWVYSSNDGTGQMSATFAEAFYSNGSWSYTPLISVGSESHFTFKPSDFGWTSNSEHYFCAAVRSQSNILSAEFSEPQLITVASRPVITVSGIGGGTSSTNAIHDKVVVVDEENNITETIQCLTSMPINFTVTGAGIGGSTTVLIERADDIFEAWRPNETIDMGFEGETVYLETIENAATEDSTGETVEFTINTENLIGNIDKKDKRSNSMSTTAVLDDEARYRMLISVRDIYNQVVTYDPIEFMVNWDHQAIVPEGEVEFDHDRNVAYITPIAPTGTLEGDTCDIYRLSVDNPQLIISDAQFGTKYVDPYPTIGINGGYRLVFKTSHGDYKLPGHEFAYQDFRPAIAITSDDADTMAFDLEEPTGRLLYSYDEGILAQFFIRNGHLFVSAVDNNYGSIFAIIIDFGGDTLFMPGNVALNNTWKKSFQTTRYLGGSIIGDWDPGVERTGSFTAVIPVREERDAVLALRKLAEYAGVCHVRTPEGSNFYANVDVQDNREERWVNRLSKVTLTVTRVDPTEEDGLTYEQWIEDQEEE